MSTFYTEQEVIRRLNHLCNKHIVSKSGKEQLFDEYKSGKIDNVISLFNQHKELLKGKFTSNSFEITNDINEEAIEEVNEQNFNYGKLLEETIINQKQQLEKLESIRKNTSNLVWWLVAIPIILFILLAIFRVI